MKLTRLVGGSDCSRDNCPAVYLADDPATLVVQGKVLDGETTSQLVQLGDDELAVAISTETVLQAAALINESQR